MCRRCRFCSFKHLFGNLYFCETSGQTHVCDCNCTNRIYYDSSTTICRSVPRQLATSHDRRETRVSDTRDMLQVEQEAFPQRATGSLHVLQASTQILLFYLLCDPGAPIFRAFRPHA